MRILVIEDEQSLREQLRDALGDAGYVVDVAADGEEGLYCGREFPVDLAVVDLGLPKLDGVELIRQLRGENRNFPIIILTARDSWQEKVQGLDAGADDYLVKPFYVEELQARIKALVRRSKGFASARLAFGPVVIDTAAKQVSLGDEPVALTAYEYNLLEYLALNAGRVISKGELVEHLYDDDSERDSNVLEVFVRRLRLKLDADDALHPIETVRGQGYRFALAADDG